MSNRDSTQLARGDLRAEPASAPVSITLTGVGVPRTAITEFIDLIKNSDHTFSLYVSPYEEDDTDTENE